MLSSLVPAFLPLALPKDTPTPERSSLQTDRPLPLESCGQAFLVHATTHPQSHSTALDKDAVQPSSVSRARE